MADLRAQASRPKPRNLLLDRLAGELHGLYPKLGAISQEATATPVTGSGNTQFIVTFSGPGTTPIPGGTGNVIKDGLYVLNVVGSHVHGSRQKGHPHEDFAVNSRA